VGTVEMKALAFLEDSSKVICVIQVYFPGEAAIAQVSIVVSNIAVRKGP